MDNDNSQDKEAFVRPPAEPVPPPEADDDTTEAVLAALASRAPLHPAETLSADPRPSKLPFIDGREWWRFIPQLKSLAVPLLVLLSFAAGATQTIWLFRLLDRPRDLQSAPSAIASESAAPPAVASLPAVAAPEQPAGAQTPAADASPDRSAALVGADPVASPTRPHATTGVATDGGDARPASVASSGWLSAPPAVPAAGDTPAAETPALHVLTRLPAVPGRSVVLPSVPAAPVSSARHEAVAEPRRELPPAPPAAPPPAAPPTAPTVTASGDEVGEIYRALGRYERAYERLDVTATAEVWPTVERRALARAFAMLKSQNIALEGCTVDANGATALATCEGQVQFVRVVGSGTPRTEPQRWTFWLRKAGDTWQIEDVRAAPRNRNAPSSPKDPIDRENPRAAMWASADGDPRQP